MEESRTPAAIRRSEARLRFLSDLAAATQPLGDASEIMNVTARLLGRYLSANRCAYAEVEADEEHYLVAGDYNDGVSSIVGRYAFTAEFGPEVVRLLRGNRPFVLEDVRTDPRTTARNQSAYERRETQSLICVPLHKDGRLVAALAVHQKTPRAWAVDECELVELVAARCWESLQRCRALHALQETAERLSLALSAASMGDWSWESSTDLLTPSERAAEIFGLPPGRSMAWWEVCTLVHADDREPVFQSLHTSADSGTRFEVEYRLIHPTGREVWVAAFGVPVREAQNRVIGLYGVVHDVTERKQMEEELRVRAEKLAENDLRKDEFLATLAHELRNPLAPLRSSLELLGRVGVADDVKARAHAVMARQVNQMTRLVDELIDVSRISSGKIQLRIEPVTLASVIDLACEISRPLIDERGHTLLVSLPPEPCHIRADATRMAQLISNLLNNAAKYSPPKRRIWLDAEVQEAGIELRVRDEGVGIDAQMLPQIFAMFTQLPRSAQTASGGLGIGLALARKLAELQGGRLTAHSEGAGRGSEFTLRYPQSIFDPDAVTAEPAAGPPTTSAPLRVLVVDDNEDAALTLATLIELDGHAVQVASEGLQAIEMMAAQPADVVLLDIGMPTLDGYEVARRMRSRFGDRPKLIAVTGWGQQRDRDKTREAGFDHHVVKPVEFDELRALLRPASC